MRSAAEEHVPTPARVQVLSLIGKRSKAAAVCDDKDSTRSHARRQAAGGARAGSRVPADRICVAALAGWSEVCAHYCALLRLAQLVPVERGRLGERATDPDQLQQIGDK